MGGGRKRLFPRRGARLRVPRTGARDRRQDSRQGRQGRRVPIVRRRAQVECQLRLSLDGERRSLQGHRPYVYRRLFGVTGGHFRAGRFKGEVAGRSCRRADFGRLSIRQPLCHRAGARALSQGRPDQAQLCRRHAVQAYGATDRRQGAGGEPVQRALSPPS